MRKKPLLLIYPFSLYSVIPYIKYTKEMEPTKIERIKTNKSIKITFYFLIEVATVECASYIETNPSNESFRKLTMILKEITPI